MRARSRSRVHLLSLFTQVRKLGQALFQTTRIPTLSSRQRRPPLRRCRRKSRGRCTPGALPSGCSLQSCHLHPLCSSRLHRWSSPCPKTRPCPYPCRRSSGNPSEPPASVFGIKNWCGKRQKKFSLLFFSIKKNIGSQNEIHRLSGFSGVHHRFCALPADPRGPDSRGRRPEKHRARFRSYA